MTKRRCTADRVTVAIGHGGGRMMVRDDVVDFDEVLVPGADGVSPLTLGEAVGRHLSAFVSDLVPAVPVLDAPALPSPARKALPRVDGEKE